MAKLAGELKKPDGLIVLRPEDIPGKIDKVKVSNSAAWGKSSKFISPKWDQDDRRT